MAVIIRSSTPTTLAQTIGSILTALIDAQAQSARTTIDFVNEIGFMRDPSDQTDKLRSVQFKYSKLDENNERKEFIVDIPLLALVDIPVIAIKTAKIEFEYDVVSTQVQQASAATAATGSGMPLGIVKERTILKGVVPRKGTNESEKAVLKISIEIEKSPLPIGLDKAMNILEVASSEEKKLDNA